MLAAYWAARSMAGIVRSIVLSVLTSHRLYSLTYHAVLQLDAAYDSIFQKYVSIVASTAECRRQHALQVFGLKGKITLRQELLTMNYEL